MKTHTHHPRHGHGIEEHRFHHGPHWPHRGFRGGHGHGHWDPFMHHHNWMNPSMFGHRARSWMFGPRGYPWMFGPPRFMFPPQRSHHSTDRPSSDWPRPGRQHRARSLPPDLGHDSDSSNSSSSSSDSNVDTSDTESVLSVSTSADTNIVDSGPSTSRRYGQWEKHCKCNKTFKKMAKKMIKKDKRAMKKDQKLNKKMFKKMNKKGKKCHFY